MPDFTNVHSMAASRVKARFRFRVSRVSRVSGEEGAGAEEQATMVLSSLVKTGWRRW